MKKIALAAATAMFLIACTDDTSTTIQTDTPASDSTATAVVADPSVPEDHYQPESLDKMSIIRTTLELPIENMTAPELSALFGNAILGDESDIYNGTYSSGVSKEGKLPNGTFSFSTDAQKSKNGTWHLYHYNGAMSYGKPAGDWVVGYMNFVDGKTVEKVTISIPFKNETCGAAKVQGQLHPLIKDSNHSIELEGDCTAQAAFDLAKAIVDARVKTMEEKKALKAKAEK